MIELAAPAKVNLGLEVLGRRPDGYHNLRSIMVVVDRADRITVGAGEGIEVTGPYAAGVPVSGEANLAGRALVELERRSGHSLRRRLRIEKLVPAEAGLGGGSADAAAILRAARQLGVELDAADLAAIAVGLGADVPFQLAGGIAVVGGVGEEVEPLPYRPLHLAVALSPAGASTAAVFAALDAAELSDGTKVEAAALALRQVEPSAADPYPRAVLDALGRLPNGLLAAASRVQPALLDAASALQAAGWHPRLTGTGSAWFQVCPDAAAAGALAAAASAAGLTAWAVRTLPSF